MSEETTKQVTPPELRNPTGAGGFADHPENRSNGHWDSKNTFSFQMNRFKAMTLDEMNEWNRTTPTSIRTIVEDLAYKRVFNARERLDEFKEVADRTEGKARQVVTYKIDDPVTEVNINIKKNNAPPPETG